MDGHTKPQVCIVMRSRNDLDVIDSTLEWVSRQRYLGVELWHFDSTSDDGTLEIIKKSADPGKVLTNDPSRYNPGRILNEAVSVVGGDIVVFLNSDATPEDDRWLENLLAPFEDPRVGVVYGRQKGRSDCRSLFLKDTERAFGDGMVSKGWNHFFSMANSAARREVLEQFPFETGIQYSEDVEWSRRVKQAGFEVVYASDAVVFHSHNYTLMQSYKRHFGEGKAEAWIFRDGSINFSFWRYVLLSFVREVLRDWVWGVKTLSFEAFWHSIPLRLMQKWGRWRGYKTGIKEYGL